MGREEDPEMTRRELLEELKQAQSHVERIRELRDAHEGAAREDLDRRLRYCERVLEEMREGMREVERIPFVSPSGKISISCKAALPRS